MNEAHRPMQLRTVKFWVRLKPRVGKRATAVLHKIYRTKKNAKAACRKGEEIMQVTGHYWAGNPKYGIRFPKKQTKRKRR